MHKPMKTLRKILRLNYVLNLRTKEIHYVKREHKNCHIDRIKRKLYVWKFVVYLLCLFSDKWNGCYWCMRNYDTDKE
jgi:hypothetical protein